MEKSQNYSLASLLMAFILLFTLILNLLPNKISAQVTVGNTNPYSGIVYPPEQGVAYVEPGTTHRLPSISQDGIFINPSVHPYTWSSADSAIVSVDTTVTPYTYTAGIDYRETILTASYQGETASFKVKVRELSNISGAVTTSGLTALPPFFPGLTTGFAASGLSDFHTNNPITSGQLSFYDNYKIANGNLLCTTTTNTTGNGSCAILKLKSYAFFCVYFSGNALHAPKYKCNMD